MESTTVTNRQQNRLLVIVVAVAASSQFVRSVFLTSEDVPTAVVVATGLSVVGMLTGAAWLTVRWVRDR